jgi:basic membrane protein A
MKLKKLSKILLLSLILTLMIGCANTEKANVEEDKLKVSLILDEGGVNDASFNESAWGGALAAKEKYGVEVNYIEAKQESDYASNIESAIDQEADLIIGVGFKLANTIEEAAKLYPEQKFAAIDCAYENIPSNVQPILFNEEEAGYAAGLVAANMTKTNKIGFVGGMDIPSVTNFLIGFEKAIKEENKDIEVLSQYANSFTDTAKGRIIAEQMINDKCDIIFTAGGAVNFGVFEATKEKGLYSIGVDMPSAHISPNIITSALKNVGVGVELTIQDLVNEQFEGGKVKMFDLSNGGVGYEITDHLSEDLIKYVDSKINK